MIQDLIRDLSRIAGDLGAIEADTIAIFNKRDRTSGPRAISADLAKQVAEETIALSRFMSHFLIDQLGASYKLRLLCYKIGYMADQAACMIVSIRKGQCLLSDPKCSHMVSILLILMLCVDRANAEDWIKSTGCINPLHPEDCSLLALAPINEALHGLRHDRMTESFQKIASKYEFEPVVHINLSCDRTIEPPKYLGDAVMVALYGPRAGNQYSIQIIDMIKVFVLYYHFAESFLYCGDFLRAQAYALDMVSDYIRELDSAAAEHSKLPSPYKALCVDALRNVAQRVVGLNVRMTNFDVRHRVSMHILNAVKEVRNISHQPGMGSHNERVVIMNKFFRSVEDFVMPYYLIQDIPEPTLAGAHAHVSDEALYMQVSTLEDALASASSSVQGMQRP